MEEDFQTPVRGGGGGRGAHTPMAPFSSIRPAPRRGRVRALGLRDRTPRRVVQLRDPSSETPPTKTPQKQEEEEESSSFTFDASMNLEHLDPNNPADAMLLEIEDLLKTPSRGPLRPKTLFQQELHEDNWNMEEQTDVASVQRDVHTIVHDSFSMELSDINPADIGPDEHDEHMQHLLDMQFSREFESLILEDREEEEEPEIRRPILAMRRDGQQGGGAFTIPQQQQQLEAPPRRPTFEIYVPDDSMEELNASTSLSVLDDGKRSRLITLKGMSPVRMKINPAGKTRAAVSAFALKIISIPDNNNVHHVAIRTWFPRIHDNGNIDRGVTFTFQHVGSSYGRRLAGLMGVSRPAFPRQSVAPFHPPVGLFTLHASLFPSSERYARETGDGMPGVNSIFLMPPGSFVTVLSPLDSRFMQNADHVVLELEYVIHERRETLMRLAVNKAVFAGLLFYDQRTVVFAGVPVTESMQVDIKLHVRVRQKTNDQVLIVAVEKAEFTVPYGFEGVVREQQIVHTTASPK